MFWKEMLSCWCYCSNLPNFALLKIVALAVHSKWAKELKQDALGDIQSNTFNQCVPYQYLTLASWKVRYMSVCLSVIGGLSINKQWVLLRWLNEAEFWSHTKTHQTEHQTNLRCSMITNKMNGKNKYNCRCKFSKDGTNWGENASTRVESVSSWGCRRCPLPCQYGCLGQRNTGYSSNAWI